MTTQDLKLEAGLDEMARLITRFATGDGIHETALRGVTLHRASAPKPRQHGVNNPCIAVIAQGAKRVMLGDEVFFYDRARYLVASVDLPASGQVIEASAEKPYLGIKIDVDPHEIAALLLEAAPPRSGESAPARGLFLCKTGPELVDALVRLLRLLEAPEDIPALAPVARREILYRVLKGEEGFRLRQIANASSHATRIARTIEWLRKHFTEPLRVDQLASQANMSASAFHEHFREVTAMSPLQFQKQLRLQEARQLLLSESLDAATAGHRVGYESPSQFSREYSRLFGAPPATDIRKLRGSLEASV
jgi:AraC-like DNA-binding protein